MTSPTQPYSLFQPHGAVSIETVYNILFRVRKRRIKVKKKFHRTLGPAGLDAKVSYPIYAATSFFMYEDGNAYPFFFWLWS